MSVLNRNNNYTRIFIIEDVGFSAIAMSAGSSKDRTLVKETPGNIFDIVSEMGRRNREQVVQTIKRDEVSLGMVDPDTGRYHRPYLFF